MGILLTFALLTASPASGIGFIASFDLSFAFGTGAK